MATRRMFRESRLVKCDLDRLVKIIFKIRVELPAQAPDSSRRYYSMVLDWTGPDLEPQIYLISLARTHKLKELSNRRSNVR